jgi:thiol-disulfide isomerase/thioredoxin
MRKTWKALTLTMGIFALGPSTTGDARAQELPKPPPAFPSLAALHASYREQFAALERRRLTDLAALASRSGGAERDAAYRDLFHLAIARDLWHEAGPAAEQCLAAAVTASDVHALAVLVTMVNRYERRQFDQALAALRPSLGRPPRPGAPGQESGDDSLLGVCELFLRRLLRSGRYDQARTLCSTIAVGAKDPDLAAHFKARLRPLELVGRAAPPLAADDVDGRPVRLADLRGKVVLIVFWATWCPPCLTAFPRLDALRAKYQAQRFEVLGVNLDAHHEDVGDVKSALPLVRHALIHHGVTWPNVVDGEGEGAIARAYGVATLPASFLVGRDGTVLGFELSEPELEPAVVRALGKPRK